MAGIVADGGRESAGKNGHGLPDLHAGTVRRALTDAGQNRFTVLLPRRDNPDATATLRTHNASKIRRVFYLLSPFTDEPQGGGGGRGYGANQKEPPALIKREPCNFFISR
jgi:hypothetical protein